MSSSMPIQHFTHIHPLVKVDGHGSWFICNGCNTYGFGTTYRCLSCDYDLHDHCATCPLTLPSFMHPQHSLQQVFGGPDQKQQNGRQCDICGELVGALHYHCEPCDFDVHPLCTKLPQYVRHVPHPDHHLELSHQGASNTCKVCFGQISSWRYKCGLCKLDVHIKCVKSSVSAGAAMQQKYVGSPPEFHHSQYNQPNNNHGYTNQEQLVKKKSSISKKKMFRFALKVAVRVTCHAMFGHSGGF